MLGLAGLPAYGQDNDKAKEHPNGIVHDWSNHHVVFPLYGEIHSLIKVQGDSRATQSWQAAFRRNWWDSGHRFLPPQARRARMVRDWNIGLGNGTVAPAMYPAKFGFNPDAAPSCANDFAVFPVNVAGGSGQPNIVGFNNLYSGTAGTTGICNAGQPGITRTTGADDDGVSATTIFSYAIAAAGGVVATSPALSIDGTKIAFVETGSGTTAHFHVLAWKSGDGVAANLQTTTSPKQITSGFATSNPTAGEVTDLILAASGTASDTLSSPFVDYANDVAYVGDDSGTLFRITNVFCTLASCAGAAPALDTTWGSGGALVTGCGAVLTGAVVDPNSGNVFVGCSNGKLYGFNPTTGDAIAGSPLTVGTGSGTGGIVDPPLIDAVDGLLYVVSGNNGTNAVLVQASTSSFSSPTPVVATLGATASFNLHLPAFNNNYFSSTTAASWMLYEYTSQGSSFTLWGIPFTGSHLMTGGTPTLSDGVSIDGAKEISPLTEFFNTNSGADWLFASALNLTSNDVVNWSITGTSTTNGFPGSVTSLASYGTGTSAFIVDNDGGSGQESSVYFGALGGGGTDPNSAVKLTQSGLE